MTRGSNVLLPCVALCDGQAPEVTSWTHRGQLITILGGLQSRRIIHENGSLSIAGFGLDELNPDDGMYRCIAEMPGSKENFIRVATPQIRLEVASMARQFTREPRSLAIAVGSTAMFACQVASRPPASYVWLKEDGGSGGTVDVRTSGERIVVYPDEGVLEIRSMTPSDLGDYRCRATALLGGNRQIRTSDPARLSAVRTGPADASAPPEFAMRPWDVSVREGGTATLFCAANSAAGSARRTLITWLKDGSTVDTAYEYDGRLTIVGSGSLRVTNATEADTGVYTCRADNAIDSADADAVLTVLVPPKFVARPGDASVVAGRDVELECSVYGVPQPRVYWLKDSEELTEAAAGDYVRVVAGRGLRINGATDDDAGAYQCVAESEAGRAHAVAQLIVLPDATANVAPNNASASSTARPSGGASAEPAAGAAPPLPPRELVVAAVTSRSASLVWQPPDGGAEAAYYHVVSREADSPRVRTANVTTASFSQSSLKPNTPYLFRVFAVGRDGRRGDVPAEITVRTRQEIPVPSAPTNFTAFAVSPTEVRVSWSPPTSQQLSGATPIRAYRVYYYAGQQVGELSINLTSTAILLDRLQIHTDYYVRVAAINAVGEGIPSEELHVRTHSAVPGAPPRNVTAEATSTHSVLVQWSPPPVDRQNGVITGYKLRYKPRDRTVPAAAGAASSASPAAAGATVTTDGDARSYEISGLEAGEPYLVRVAATNVNGTGDYTSWIAVSTYASDVDENTVPGKLSYIQTRVFATEIIISWAPPTGSVMIRGYRLGYGPVTPDHSWIELPPTERHYTIRNLRPGQSYVMQLRAFNNAGQGFPIMAQEVTRDTQQQPVGESSSAGNEGGSAAAAAGELAPPLQLKATVLSATAVLVAWHDNSLGANQRVTDNRYYTIRFGALTGTIRKAKMVNSTELSYIVDGLRPFTKYEFAVKVVKGTRESVFSLYQRNTTFEAAPASAPLDLTITASDSSPGEVVVSWQPPIKANGRITSYLLYYATDSRQDIRYWVMESVAGDRLNKRVRSVTADTTYFFRIEAHNAKGRGPLSSTEVFRTPKADGTGGGGILVNPGVRPSQTPDGGGVGSGKGRGAPEPLGGSAAPPKASTGEISQEVMWIIVGCVAAITLVAIVALIVVCRRRMAGGASADAKRSGAKGAAAQAADSGGVVVPQPPDLFKNHEQLQLKQRQLPPLDAGGPLRPVDEIVPMLDPNRRSYDDDHHSVSVGADTFIDTYSSLGRSTRPVIVTPQGLCREGMPRAAVQPMSVVSASLELPPGSRHAQQYPRTQYHQQYGSGARVHVGDSSCATPPPSSHVRPQVSSSFGAYSMGAYGGGGGDRSDSDSLKKTPRSTALSTRSDMSSMGGSRHEVVPLTKTLSSEQLSEDVVNLDGIMKELNNIKMQIDS